MKLLVVDDELQVLNFVKSVLESFGYKVLALNNSRMARDLVDREEFGAAFVDARMPDVDGFALAQHIRDSPLNRNIPIVIMTGFSDVETMRAAFKVGVTFFMPKPLDGKKLAHLLTAMDRAMLRENRLCIRMPVQTIVDCRSGQSEFKGLSRDISESGMLLDGAGDVSVGEKIEMCFSLPGIAGTVNARATVVRAQPYGSMAVQFIGPEANVLKATRGYITGIFEN